MAGSADNVGEHSRTPGRARLAVLVENGEYLLQNKGDLALLAVTVRRLRERLPAGRIGVLTNAPTLLHAYEPEAVPVRYDRGRLTGRLPLPGPPLPLPVAVTLLDLTERLRGLDRRVAHRLGSLRRSRSGRGATADGLAAGPEPILRQDRAWVLDEAQNAALVIAMGGGYLTDADPLQAHRTLALLDQAVQNGVPTAMLGQGIGPMTDDGLLHHARRVLPKVGLIALREQRRGPQLLRSLGVPDDIVVITGDDSIELAYGVRPPSPGHDIGICMRVASYSPVPAGAQAEVGRVVRQWAASRNAGLRPVIISEYLSEDRRATLPLTAGYPASRRPLPRSARPVDLAREVGRCRVLVTGAYHAAVFALSQGVPVVGLSASEYYDDKLAGLASMFGFGMEVVRLDGDHVASTLGLALARAWEDADAARVPLLRRAEDQIALSRSAFDRACGLVAG